jgi:hypothetical protein
MTGTGDHARRREGVGGIEGTGAAGRMRVLFVAVFNAV